MELNWIDYDKKKMEELLLAFDTPGTLDELGLGIVRDYFADILFPGTSTLHSHAKYFFLTMYILIDLGINRFQSSKEYYKELNQKEKKCSEILCKKYENETGIIGRNQKNNEWVALTPSYRYWSAMRKYKIIKPDITLNTYINNVINNDKEIALKDFWDTETYTSNWLKEENLTLELTKQEKEFLANHILDIQENSLLEECIKNKIPLDKIIEIETNEEGIDNDPFSKLVSIIDQLNLSKETKENCILAKEVSDFLWCAQLRYRYLITKDEKIKEEWDRYYYNHMSSAANLDLNKLSKIKDNTDIASFFKELQEIMLQKNKEEKEQLEKQLDECIMHREAIKKGKKAKLYKGETLPNYEGLPKLTYRIEIAASLLKDIEV